MPGHERVYSVLLVSESHVKDFIFDLAEEELNGVVSSGSHRACGTRWFKA
jgi:hypothetical protein